MILNTGQSSNKVYPSRPCYAGSKSSAERLKRGIVYARILVRECLVEAERSARN